MNEELHINKELINYIKKLAKNKRSTIKPLILAPSRFHKTQPHAHTSAPKPGRRAPRGIVSQFLLLV